MDINHIYLDNASTTPIDPNVQDVIVETSLKAFGNASSVHSFGRKSKVILEEARETIAQSLGANSNEITFTSGGTESDNLALIGGALAIRERSGKNHLIISAIEHHAVLHTSEFLQSMGFSVTILPVSRLALVDIDAMINAITPHTGLVSIMHANNEVGTIQPIPEISSVLHEKGIVLHIDAVQSFGKISVEVHELGADLLSISAHKIYGPKGIGALYIRNGIDIHSLTIGGSQERGHRAGTENIPLIAGFAKAVELAILNMKEEYERFAQYRYIMKNFVQINIDGAIFNGHQELSLPNILSISLDPHIYAVEAETVLLQLDLNGVAASSGSACTSGSIQPSHVLLALGYNTETARSTVRFSFGRFNKEEDIMQASEIFRTIVKQFQQ